MNNDEKNGRAKAGQTNAAANLLSVCSLLVFSVTAAILLSSGGKMQSAEDYLMSKSLSEDIESSVLSINDNINAEIFDLPKVYTLPVDLSAAPTPNPDNFTDSTYEDETITVKCWRERITISDRTVTANFAEITIAHPTQLRTAFAGGSYGSSARTYASVMAAANNAVVAINADFYNCRTDGIILRQGTLYRSEAFGIDVLLIDSNGDFTVMRDREVLSSGYLEENDIYQCIGFGPVLVENGEALVKGEKSNSIVCGVLAKNPRSAIGQLGTLHYLLCTIDGRSSVSMGVTTNELAEIMAEKGCITAYNLDGGQSSTLVFNNSVYNVVSNGGERKTSDIIYFASAIPESEWQ